MLFLTEVSLLNNETPHWIIAIDWTLQLIKLKCVTARLYIMLLICLNCTSKQQTSFFIYYYYRHYNFEDFHH